MSFFTTSQQQYAHAATPTPAPGTIRQAAAVSVLSAARQTPDEDWTKISDTVERRKIQNRIAQRNYRKKLKRRLEDLERKAGDRNLGESSSQGTPKPSKRMQPTKTQKIVQPLRPTPQNQYPLPLREGDLLFPSAFGRERSRPLFIDPPPEGKLTPNYQLPTAVEENQGHFHTLEGPTNIDGIYDVPDSPNSFGIRHV